MEEKLKEEKADKKKANEKNADKKKAADKNGHEVHNHAKSNSHAGRAIIQKDPDEKAENSSSEEGFEFSIKKDDVARFLRAYGFILLLLIPILVSIFIRAAPASLPIMESFAENNINNMLKSNIEQQISKQYPNLPAERKKQIVNEQLAQIKKQGKINIGGQELKLSQIVEQQATLLRQKFQRDKDQQTYLLAIDPYLFYRYTRNYLDHGFDTDKKNSSGYFDLHILAGQPKFKGTTKKISNFHVFVEVWTYRIASFFNKDITVMKAIFYLPLILATLAIIPAFFIARKIAGNIGGLFAGLMVALHPAFLTRTTAGFSDTDAYNVLFPLLIVWFFMESLSTGSKKAKVAYNVAAGFVIALFAYTWSGWLFIFNLIIAISAAYLAYSFLEEVSKRHRSGECRKNKSIPMKLKMLSGAFRTASSKIWLQLLSFVLSSIFFITTIAGSSKIKEIIYGTFKFIRLKEVGTYKIWPNVYTTVAELNPASLSQVISNISLNSKLLLLFAILGLVFALLYKAFSFGQNRENKEAKDSSLIFLGLSVVYYLFIIGIKSAFTSHLLYSIAIVLPVFFWMAYAALKGFEIDAKYAIMLSVWLVATFYASSKGVRFVLLIVPVYSLAIGIAVGVINKALVEWITKELKLSRALVAVVIGFFSLSLIFFPVNQVKAAVNVANNEVPSMNDQWYTTLTKIKEESAKDAIINSWWDFGHWFAAIADRAVTLDGGRQNNPQAHWLGKLMLTGSEKESVGILRYLDCGGNYGYDLLLNYTRNDSLKAIGLVYKIIVENKTTAKGLLTDNGLTEKQAEKVLRYTHCKPPEDYFITSEDMVGKSGVWAHFGSWNFTKALIYSKIYNIKDENKAVNLLEESFGLNESTAKRFYRETRTTDADHWIAPWPSYMGTAACKTDKGGDGSMIVVCQSGLVFNYSNYDAYFMTAQGIKRPKSISFIDNSGNFAVRSFNESVFEANGRIIGAALVPEGNSFKAVVMDNALVPSIFTRLFYFEGKGLKHFKEFYKTRDVTGQKIIVWNVSWTVAEKQGSESLNSYSQSLNSRDLNSKNSIGNAWQPKTAYDLFSECLSSKNATFYGTESCSHCREQKAVLNSSEMPYVSCDMNPVLCTKIGIKAYPTWIIAGKSYLGVQSIEDLENITGCKLES